MFFSFVGGYPTGARLLGSLVDDGRLTPHDAGTLLSFCVGSGPAFVVLAVGKGMFGSAKTGIILLSSQLIANLVIGSVICRKNPVAVSFCGNNDKPLYSSFVRAVAQASSGVMTICSYVVLISALCASLDFNGKVNALFSVAEVTAGCLYASKQSGVSALCLASFLLAFSGISVCCQISAIAMQYSIPVSPFIKGRLICGVLSSVMTFILTRLFPQSVKAAYILSEPIAASSPNRILCAVCLCIMATITFSDFNEKVDF